MSITITVADWTMTASGDTASFTHASVGGYWAPRVWSGHGLAMAVGDLPAFEKVLGELMKQPIYWLARARRRDVGAGEAAVWLEPRYDAEDEIVYLGGPCRAEGAAAGYRPASAFVIDLVHLRGLRIRIAAYRVTAGCR
ncbi:hypothetical protein [Amycolatopsis plumensis]|uniref:Uncharacterized protein n=1 Tax=Amycolatopsis plumensis TaxID=236508 RepID=A0ABV5UJ26_9PSEU